MMLARHEDHPLRLFMVTLVVAGLTYGQWLTSFVLNIDGEVPDNFYQTIALGRWFHAVLRFGLLPEPFLPYFTNLTSLFVLSAAACLAALTLSLRGYRAVFFSVLFVTFPNLAYQLEFLNQADTFAVGYGLAILSAYLFLCGISAPRRVSQYGYLVLAVVLLALALGIYQTLVLVPAVLVAGRLLLQTDEELIGVSNLRLAVPFCVYTILAVLLYTAGTAISQGLIGVDGQSYFSGYVEGRSFGQYVIGVGSAFGSSLVGRSAFGFITYILATVAAVFLIAKGWKRAVGERVQKALLVVAVLLLPFAFVLLSGTKLPPRIYVAANLSFAILLTAATSVLWSRKAVFVLLMCLCIFHCNAITRLFVSDKRVRDADIQMASQIATIIRVKYPTIDLASIPVYFHGAHTNLAEEKLPGSDIFGSSFFAWDNGNDVRIKNFNRYYGIADYRPVGPEQIKAVEFILPTLPTWPDANSIALSNGVVVVKLGAEYGWLPFSIR
ncbi:glucosyltransferase domain-containing protein [Tianweitania populi]|uniref:Glucosyl transferase II n=1 Tax=Tianweitania populi TaxID=1607949 RepID=A0A8J3GJM4_9HYPH|nr:glucosyltransferase domain-containing protein [Tianweitania populi]GHD07642.1 glucosyl transferase II [Tianweitania populi]